MNIKKLLFILTIILSLSFASDIITFQGRLIDSTGAAVNGYREMGFKIYNAEQNGELIMIIPHKNVLCNDGNYAQPIYLSEAKSSKNNVLTAEPATQLINNHNVWIEVYVGLRDVDVFNAATESDHKMSPRINLTATPYAVSAKQIQGLDIKRFKTGVTDNMEFYY